MASPKPETKETVPCDFCSHQTALLYCPADSARLCLSCDQHVHSANPLSSMHVRSQICDNCASKAVSVRCATDNLVLCQECDRDAHYSSSVSAAHDRSPVEGFSGCPSPADLGVILGFHLEEKSLVSEPFIFEMQGESQPWGLEDLMVPGNAYNDDEVCADGIGKKESAGCGRYEQVVLKQLVELFNRYLLAVDCVGEGGEDLLSRTPSRSDLCLEGDDERCELGNSNDTVTAELQQEGFTSTLVLPSRVVDLNPGGGVGGDSMGDRNANAHGPEFFTWKP